MAKKAITYQERIDRLEEPQLCFLEYWISRSWLYMRHHVNSAAAFLLQCQMMVILTFATIVPSTLAFMILPTFAVARLLKSMSVQGDAAIDVLGWTMILGFYCMLFFICKLADFLDVIIRIRNITRSSSAEQEKNV